MELIGIAADHGGFELKEILKPLLVKAGFQVKDYGAVRFDGGELAEGRRVLAGGSGHLGG